MKQKLFVFTVAGIISVTCAIIVLGVPRTASASEKQTTRLELVGSNYAGGMAGGVIGGSAGSNIRVAQY